MTPRVFAPAPRILVAVSVVQADEFTGTRIKAADGKVTFFRGVGKKKKEFTPSTQEQSAQKAFALLCWNRHN